MARQARKRHGTSSGLALSVAAFGAALAIETSRSGTFGQALRAWWIDPSVSTLSFSFAIAVYDREERKLGCKPRGFMSAGSVSPLLLALFSYWGGVLLWVATVPAPPDIPDGVPGTLCELVYLVLEVICGVVAYDFVFYCVHCCMHWTATLWGPHKTHHSKTTEVRARDVLLHSPIDGTLQVLVNILVQRCNIWGATKSRLARAIHNVVVTWMLTESHTASPVPKVARHFFVGVRRHRAHHMVDAPFYQQFFGYLDDARIAMYGKHGPTWTGSCVPCEASPVIGDARG